MSYDDFGDDFFFARPKKLPKCSTCGATCYWDTIGKGRKARWVLFEKGRVHDCINNPKIKSKLFTL